MGPLNFVGATIHRGLVTFRSSQSHHVNSQPGLEVSLEESSSFPETSPFSFFIPSCLFCSCSSFGRLVSCLCVHRKFDVFGSHCLALQAPFPTLQTSHPPHILLLCSRVCVCVCGILVFIRAPLPAGSPPPLHINIVCRTGISARSRVENLGVFIIQRPCSLCCFSGGGGGGGGGAKVCVFGRGEDAGLTPCH